MKTRRGIPMTNMLWEAVQRVAKDKEISGAELVRRTIRQADWFLWDKREQELKRELEAKQ